MEKENFGDAKALEILLGFLISEIRGISNTSPECQKAKLSEQKSLLPIHSVVADRVFQNSQSISFSTRKSLSPAAAQEALRARQQA